MKVLMYTKTNCPHCVRAKSYLNVKGIEYTEMEIGKDVLREDFVATYPDVKTVPFFVIDGVKIYGNEQLREHLEGNTPTFLVG